MNNSRLLENSLYSQDVSFVSNMKFPWEKLQEKTILISGATGLIGSFFVDVIMKKNCDGLNASVLGLGRNREKADKRFGCYKNSKYFRFVEHDINTIYTSNIDSIDYIIHLASNTHPIAYATDPVGTVTANIIGTNNLLKLAVEKGTSRFVFASSNEIYGENRGDVELFDEYYDGYIDCNTMRAGYPESKRAGEALCQAYIKQYGLDIVIPRFTRSFGPTMLSTDTKAISQFIQKAVCGQDIILKSAGEQYYSYTYVADAVNGLLSVMLNGRNGEAYNIADESCDIKLKDLAKMIADISGNSVSFELPSATESAGYSKATKARLDGSKIKKELGWYCNYDLKEALTRTVRILRDLNRYDEYK